MIPGSTVPYRHPSPLMHLSHLTMCSLTCCRPPCWRDFQAFVRRTTSWQTDWNPQQNIKHQQYLTAWLSFIPTDQGFHSVFLPVDMEMSCHFKGELLFYSCLIYFYFWLLNTDPDELEPGCYEAKRALPWEVKSTAELFCCRKHWILKPL